MSSEPSWRLDQFSSLEGLPPAYESLWLSAARSFDQTSIWSRTFAEYLLAAGETLCVVGVYDSEHDRALGLMPLRSARGFRGVLPLRSVSTLANYYTALVEPVIGADADVDAVSAVLAGALPKLNGGWNLLDLNPLAPEHPFFRHATRALRDRACFVQPYFRFGNWYLKLAGRNFSEYFRDMPSRMRSTLTRKKKKLLARDDVRIEILGGREGLDAAVDAYEKIYASSWKRDEPHKDFIRAVARRFADAGWLRLGLVHVGQVPAAAQLWFVQGGTASIFKLAYDPAFTELSIGSVLTMTLMEHVIDVDRVGVVDYLCGDDDYKKDWMSHRRERWGLRASPWLSLVGMTEAARTAAGRLAHMARGRTRREPPVGTAAA
ncbi:MAG TPA: GNAT family N-acetyltransferase [Steroidobacteraceae bacterium]|nr:GNAT family N-acetyltransferase [Steroidobacteraceae bacterium]